MLRIHHPKSSCRSVQSSWYMSRIRSYDLKSSYKSGLYSSYVGRSRSHLPRPSLFFGQTPVNRQVEITSPYTISLIWSKPLEIGWFRSYYPKPSYRYGSISWYMAKLNLHHPKAFHRPWFSPCMLAVWSHITLNHFIDLSSAPRSVLVEVTSP